jgi:hypothetical protein
MEVLPSLFLLAGSTARIAAEDFHAGWGAETAPLQLPTAHYFHDKFSWRGAPPPCMKMDFAL